IEWCADKASQGIPTTLPASNAKISQHRLPRRAISREWLLQENIRRFNIAVDHALGVRIVQGQANRRKKLHNIACLPEDTPAHRSTERRCQRATLDIIHHHIRLALRARVGELKI